MHVRVISKVVFRGRGDSAIRNGGMGFNLEFLLFI